MSRLVLGISAFYHDSAAALVRGGEIVAAAQEERFSRKRHDASFPRSAIDYCLAEGFIEPRELGAVVYYDSTALTLDRVVRSAVEIAPRGQDHFVRACTSILGAKAALHDHVKAVLGADVPLFNADHHLSHAASAFFPSPFQEAAILTVDGVGEWATCTLGRGDGNRVELLREIRYPHSLGLLYSAFTSFCGFKVNSGEYKLMGLAPYGRPIYADLIRDHLIDLKEDGSFRLNTSYFGYLDGEMMTSSSFAELFGGSARTPESRITQREMDLAASIQVVLEEAMLRLAREARRLAGSKNLVLAGGVALNCVANGKLVRAYAEGGYWIQPAAGDAGGALGAALLVAHHHFGEPRATRGASRDGQAGSYLGPRFSGAEVRAFLERKGLPYREVRDPTERAREIARALAEGKVVGFFAGRMEFGPRALGARSILADPRRPDTQSTVNLKIKYRESFRPFAPAVLADKASEYFDLDRESPYMLLVAPVREARRLESDQPAGDDLLAIVNRPRSDVPAITHVDYSARVQTVTPDTHPDFHAVLKAFYEITGCAVLVNTSFNVRGEPIVCSPQDAYRCFMRTELDLLVLEDCLLDKSAQPKLEHVDNWRGVYELD